MTTKKKKAATPTEFESAVIADMQRQDAQHACQNAVHFICPTLTTALDSLSGPISQFMEAQGFWECENFGEKIALIHSELSEALEANRKDMQAEHIPGFSGEEEELADVIIRILDLANYRGLRLGEAIQAKMLYNLTRPFKHGKAY